MRTAIFAFLCVLFRTFASAYELPDSLRKPGGMINFETGVSFSGRGINGKLLYDFYRGGFLDSTYLADQRADLLYKNVFFAEGQQRVDFLWSPDTFLLKHGIRFGISVRNTWRSSSVFTSDAFDLLFYGNRPFEEQVKNFSGSHFFLSSWFSAGLFGSWEKATDKLDQKFSFGINALSGKRFYDAQVNRGWLYTSGEGTELQTELRGYLNQSDTALNPGFFGKPAIGRGFSVDFSYAVRMGKLSGLLAFEDIGFIDWVKGFGSFDVDTAAVLRGYYISNLFTINDSLVQLSIDSLNNAVPVRSATRFRSGLPFSFSTAWWYALNSDWRTGITVRYIGMPAYVPRFSLMVERNVSSKLTARLLTGTGAGAMVHVASGLSYKPLKAWRIDLCFSDLQGLARQAQSRGTGIYLHVMYQWK